MDIKNNKSQRWRSRLFGACFSLISVVLTMYAAEMLLRRMAAKKGWDKWVYTTNEQGNRGPVAGGPKRPGISRILVQGDSLTYGVGVSDYRELYPYQLLARLNKAGEKYEMLSNGVPGRELDGHARLLEEIATELNPDMIIYQWFVNDVELTHENRPESRSALWRRLPCHVGLKRRYYLYNLLDERLAGWLPAFNRSYEQYLLEDYAEKSRTGYWYPVRYAFHRWATRATLTANRNILLLYPLLPFKGEYPLRSLHQRMAEMAGRSIFSMPAYEMHMKDGDNVEDKASTYGLTRKAIAGLTRTNCFLVHGPYLPLGPGNYAVTFRLKADTFQAGPVAKLDVVCDETATTLAQTVTGSKDFAATNSWQDFTLPFSLAKPWTGDIEFRVTYLGNGNLSVDTIRLPTQYNVEVLDLTPHLKDLDTWASPTDGHPNAKTHKLMAELLYRQISRKP